jgi:hypothetical protein
MQVHEGVLSCAIKETFPWGEGRQAECRGKTKFEKVIRSILLNIISGGGC